MRVFIHKNSGVREELSYLEFLILTQLTQIIMEELLFGEFPLAILTFGLHTSQTENFLPTYHFTSIPISIHHPLNYSTICGIENSNDFNARLASWIILAKEVVPTFDSHIRLIPLAITTFILA